MAKKVIEFIEKQEQLTLVLQLNFFLTGFGFFYGLLLTGQTALYLMVTVSLLIITGSLFKFSERFDSSEIELAKAALWTLDIVFFQTAFFATSTTGLLFYIFLFAVSILYGSPRLSMLFLAISIGNEVWLQAQFSTKHFLLNAFSLIIFYLFFWFIAQFFQNKNNELARTREELVKAARSGTIQKMSMTLSHELNNPLTAVVINVDMLSKVIEKTKDLSKIEPLLQALTKDTHRMKQIMDDLRNINGDKMVEEEYGQGHKIYSIDKTLKGSESKGEYNQK